jgi:hypothetical protein
MIGLRDFNGRTKKGIPGWRPIEDYKRSVYTNRSNEPDLWSEFLNESRGLTPGEAAQRVAAVAAELGIA